MKHSNKILLGIILVILIIAGIISVGNGDLMQGRISKKPLPAYNEKKIRRVIKKKPLPAFDENQKKLYGKCVPVVFNGLADNLNFVIGFYDLSDDEMKNKAYDYTRAQFFRSEYDVPDKTDKNFGFIPWLPNMYQTRLGLFEIEPWKSLQKHFNVFYVNHSYNENSNPYNVDIYDDCPFLKDSKAKIQILRHQGSPSPVYSTWVLEQVGTAFNHEIGHVFGLKDEYFTEMAKNDLTPTEVAKWNSEIPNCDYSRPFNDSDYKTGNGYCKKWCNGVNHDVYKKYKTQRDLYDSCESKLINKIDLQSWLSFCSENLDFSRYYSYYGFIDTFVKNGNPGNAKTKAEACKSIFSDNSNNEFFIENIQGFCYRGSLYNIWDLDVGQSCSDGTGCFAGCGGFSKASYGSGNLGAFGDAFRPNAISIMGGGPFGNSGPNFEALLHEKDDETPTYGQYDIDAITQKLKEKGVIP